MRSPKMQVEVREATPTRIVVDVIHSPYQSYSRSVQPRANREWRSVVSVNGWMGLKWRVASFDWDRPDPAPGRCVSRVTYVSE